MKLKTAARKRIWKVTAGVIQVAAEIKYIGVMVEAHDFLGASVILTYFLVDRTTFISGGVLLTGSSEESRVGWK